MLQRRAQRRWRIARLLVSGRGMRPNAWDEFSCVDHRDNPRCRSCLQDWQTEKSVTSRSRPLMSGLLLYIMVDSVTATIDSVIAHGGELVQPIGADAPEITARFRDPAGNVIGLYQQPSPPV